jgi:carbamoyltransferase
MIILGINAYHPDSSACLLIDGKVVFAVEEERINRVKHWSGMPLLSIRHCLLKGNISINDIDFVAINHNFFSNLFNKFKYVATNKLYLSFYFEKFRNLNKKKNILDILVKNFGNLKKGCKLIGIDHHYSHVASAFYDSSFTESVNLSIDAFGDFSSVSWGIGNHKKIKIDDRVLFPHSLGIFYEAFTQFLGFCNFGDEYKIMGLSSYGKVVDLDLEKMKKIIKIEKNGKFALNLNYFNHHKDRISYSWDNCSPKTNLLFNKNFQNLFLNVRSENDNLKEYHKNLASAVQYKYEEILFHILNYIYDKYKIPQLTLSGGCAQNSLANGKIIDNTRFTKLYIPSNPGDAGGAIGSAYSLWFKLHNKRPERNLTAYLGPEYDDNEIERILNVNKKKILSKKCLFLHYSDEDLLLKFIAEEITKEKVIGWFQGRMEWGPRALGNRSIIADPRNRNIKDLINLKIKRRETFRPFAPSIISNEVNNWFDNFEEEELFMSRVVRFKKDKQQLIPGVVHIDGTGRLQTVKKADNPRYYKLIKSFQKITGIPILLNTSFNENEPIVFTPEHALECFLRTEMDILVMGNWVVHR